MPEMEPKISEAIAFFEQMLQTMPGDRTSLEFLAVAYEQTGQSEKRRDCLIRLADCLVREKDFDNAQIIAARLSAAYRGDPGASAAVERVAELIQGHILETAAPPGPAEAYAGAVPAAAAGAGGMQDPAVEVHALTRSAAAAEMELVWYWRDHEFLPKEVCMDVLHVLTEHPVSDVASLISALVLLDEQHPELTDGLMEAMQRASETAPIPLELFDPSAEALKVLSPTFIRVKGVMPFALLGGEALVAVLNPLNPALREEVVRRAGRPCHFFFAHPRSWLQLVERVG